VLLSALLTATARYRPLLLVSSIERPG
jgi:hypothetical protein